MMRTYFKKYGLSATVFLLLFSSVQLAWSQSYKSEIQRPMKQTEVVLVYFDRLLLKDVPQTISITCHNEAADTPIGECKEIALYVKDKSPQGTILKSFLGSFPREELGRLLLAMHSSFDTRFKGYSFFLATGAGFVLGHNRGSLALAIPLAVIGLSVDIIKAPFSLPYLLGSSLSRKLKKRAFEKRMRKLLLNESYKAIRICSKKVFQEMANSVREWANQYRYPMFND